MNGELGPMKSRHNKSIKNIFNKSKKEHNDPIKRTM